MSILDYLLLLAVAGCAYIAIRTLKQTGGSCSCGSGGCCGDCAGCRSRCKKD